MYTKLEVHIFNVWTIIRQSLNIKERKLFELQITQTRHPKSVVDSRTDRWTDRPSGPTTRPAFAKATQVMNQSNEICEKQFSVFGSKGGKISP